MTWPCIIAALALWLALYLGCELWVNARTGEPLTRKDRAIAHLGMLLGREPLAFARRQANHFAGIIREMWPR